MAGSDPLDTQVRAADLDRWLSSRLVSDPQARADLIALYAFEAELKELQLVDEDVDDPHRIGIADVVVEALGK